MVYAEGDASTRQSPSDGDQQDTKLARRPGPSRSRAALGRGAQGSMEDRGPSAHHAGPRGEDREQKPLPVLLPSDTPCRCSALLHICLAPIFSQLIPRQKTLRKSSATSLCLQLYVKNAKSFLEKKNKNKSHLVQAAMRQLLQLLLTFTLGK